MSSAIKHSREPDTSDFQKYVYCFVGLYFELGPGNKRKLASLKPLGTACAILDNVIYTSFHNIGKFGAFGIVRQLRRSREIALSEVIEVTLIDQDETKGWALLRLPSGNFGGEFCTKLVLNEEQLPSNSTKVVIFDYHVGMLTSSRDIDCDALHGRICWYETPKTSTTTNTSLTWLVVDKVPDKGPKSRIVFHGGPSRSSSGAPCITQRGDLFAFHLTSFKDEYSETVYSTGVVFAKSPKFVTAFNNLY